MIHIQCKTGKTDEIKLLIPSVNISQSTNIHWQCVTLFKIDAVASFIEFGSCNRVQALSVLSHWKAKAIFKNFFPSNTNTTLPNWYTTLTYSISRPTTQLQN